MYMSFLLELQLVDFKADTYHFLIVNTYCKQLVIKGVGALQVA